MHNSGFVEDDNNEDTETSITKNDKIKKESPIEMIPLIHTFEDAVALTGFGKFHYQLLLTCGFCFLSVMTHILVISMILPSIKCDIAATLEEQGLLGSAAFFGVVCGCHTYGFLGDTWGRVRTLKWSLILSTILGVISAFSPDIWTLIITRFLTGILSAGSQACVFSLCSEYHSKKTRARHVTLASMFLTMAIVSLPIIAVVVLPLRTTFTLFGIVMSSWRLMLLAININAVIGLILLHFTPETPKYELIHGNHDIALNTLSKVFSINTGRPMEEYPVKKIQLETAGANIADIKNVKDAVKMVWTQTIPVFYKERIWHTLNICLVLFLTYGIPHGLFIWYPTILHEEILRQGEEVCVVISEIDIEADKNSNYCNGHADNTANWIVIFAGAMFTGVYLGFAFTIDKLGKRNVLIFYLVLCGLCCIVVHFVSNVVLSVLVITTICSVVNAAGIVGTIAVEFYPTNINAMAMCFVMLVGRLGSVVGSNLFGHFIFDHCNGTFWIIAICLFLTAFLSWFLPEKDRPKLLSKDDKV